MKTIGDRMKANYEDRARFYLARRTPVVLRLDGKAFHTYTRGLDKPFDDRLIASMANAAEAVMNEPQGAKLAYVQSDEVSILLTDFDSLQTAAWFDYNKAKLESVSASVMTLAFYREMQIRHPDHSRSAHFDSHAFNIPPAEVANYFLWRALDWNRNSVAMYCGAHHSHKQMHGNGRADQHDMLRAKGLSWENDLCDQVRNGTWIIRVEGGFQHRHDIRPDWAQIESVVQPLLQGQV